MLTSGLLLPILLAAPEAPGDGHTMSRTSRGPVHVCWFRAPSRSNVKVVFSKSKMSPKQVGTQALGAVTGSFFHYKSGIPVADVLVDGSLLANGSRGSGFGVDWFGQVHLFDAKMGSSHDWSSFKHGLRGGVRLLSRGKVVVNPIGQGFRDQRIWGRASRSAVGISRTGAFVISATAAKLTLSEFGSAMRSVGVVEAVSFDGGGSAFLAYRGKLLVNTSRKLPTMILVNRPSH